MPLGVFVPARAEDLSLSFASGVDSAAAGALLYRNGSSRWASFAAGSGSQYLAGGTTPVWTVFPTTLSGDVTLAPGSSTRNVVQPSGNFTGLVLKNNAAQVLDPFQTQLSGGTVTTSLDASGRWGGGTAGGMALRRRAVVMADADYTLTASEYDGLFITVTSSATVTTTRNLILPLTDGGHWWIYNNITGTLGVALLNVTGASGTGVLVGQGARQLVYSDGTNVYAAGAAITNAGEVWSGSGTLGGTMYLGTSKLGLRQDPALPQQFQFTTHFTTIAGTSSATNGSGMGGQGLTCWADTTGNIPLVSQLQPGQTADAYRVHDGANGARLYNITAAGNVELRRVDSTTPAMPVATWVGEFNSNVHASYTGRFKLNAVDAAGTREVMRGEGDGTNPRVGFLGAAAIARPAVTGSRGGNAALASLLTQLASLGLVTDSSSA